MFALPSVRPLLVPFKWSDRTRTGPCCSALWNGSALWNEHVFVRTCVRSNVCSLSPLTPC